MTKIYVTPEAMRVLKLIEDLDYYNRVDNPDLRLKDGYFLNATSCDFEGLPDRVLMCADILPAVKDYAKHVRLPAELQGVVFSNAPNLPPAYAEIISYWGKAPREPSQTEAVYFQNKANEYMVPLVEDEKKGTVLEDPKRDRMLTEGIVTQITGLGQLIKERQLDPTCFIRVALPNFSLAEAPKDPAELALDDVLPGTVGGADATKAPAYQDVYLRVSDVLASPDPDSIYLDALRYELMDYGYFY